MCVCMCVHICDFTQKKAAAQLSRDTEAELTNEATVNPLINQEEKDIATKKIIDSQYKCFEKINRDPPYNKSGSDNIFWDSLCASVIGPLLWKSLTLFVALLVWQVRTAAVTSMGGCAGMILQQEPTPPKTALITFLTSIPQVSSDIQQWCLWGWISLRQTEAKHHSMVFQTLLENVYLLLNCYFQKRLPSTVGRMGIGFATQIPIGLGPTIHSATKTLQQS